MIFSPRVDPIDVKASAANGTVKAAARNAGVATASFPEKVRASHGDATNASTANGTETARVMSMERCTSPRLRSAPAAHEDRHQTHVGHVHAEARRRRGDERELGGERDDPVGTVAQAVRHDHLGGEDRGRADREAQDVLARVAQDDPLVGALPRRSDGLGDLDGFLDDFRIHARVSIQDGLARTVRKVWGPDGSGTL